MVKKILFLTGTRADFGKIKPLIKAVGGDRKFEVNIFITGMHLYPKYGNTGTEVLKSGFTNVYYFINQKPGDSMDVILANTIHGLSAYCSLLKPDIIVVHGDRAEALAGAVVGALNNILVAHVEGGEISGNIDESIRHAVSKLSHLHFVANKKARERLIQMGEPRKNIHVIGSPDIDLMLSHELPPLNKVKKHYGVTFDNYAILIYHPVTSNLHILLENTKELLDAVLKSGKNYIVVYPNNDPGADIIIEEYERIGKNDRFKIYPSIRFEYFLVLLKSCDFMIGNSSAGIREAPFYAIPSINVGNRQNGRYSCKTIIDVEETSEVILSAINNIKNVKRIKSCYFGEGKSSERFVNILRKNEIWEVKIQKSFIDRG